MTAPEQEEVKSPPPLNRAEAIQLLGYYLAAGPPRWQTLQAFVAVFITINLTLVGATIGVLDRFSRWPSNLFIASAPITALVIAHLSKKAIRRQDRHIRELLVPIAHLEQQIGLDSISPSNTYTRLPFWPKDVSYLPTRWAASRLKHASSEDFIDDQRVGGTAGAALQMFGFVQILCLLLIVYIAALPWLSK